MGDALVPTYIIKVQMKGGGGAVVCFMVGKGYGW